jgi:lysophospholipid acyltransferase
MQAATDALSPVADVCASAYTSVTASVGAAATPALTAVKEIAAPAMALGADAYDAWAEVAPSLEQVATPAFVLTGVDTLAGIASVSTAEVRLFLCLITAYPLALTWRALPGGKNARHVFSVVIGLWMLLFVNGSQAMFNLAAVTLCYLVMWIAGPNSARLVSALAISILAGGHLYRQISDYLGWTLDWTLIAMITTQKVMGLAYNVQDGQDPNATKEQKSLAVSKLPSLLEYYSFILFPANLTIGPAFEYSDYMAFADGSLKSPAPYLPGLSRLTQGLFYFVAHTAISLSYPCAVMLADKTFFTTGNIFTRYFAVWIGLVGVRFKYYFGWKIAEGAACMSGLGYNGVDKTTGAHKWNRVENVCVIKYETSQSLRESSQNWNKTTNLWLRRYVYDRTPASISLYATYIFSAFWHGFYPGYYLFFCTVAVCAGVHRNIRRSIRPRFMAADGVSPGPFKRLYDLASAIATSMTVNYFIMSFTVLAWGLSLDAFRGFGFFGHWILAAALVIFKTGLIRAPAKIKLTQKTQ